MKKKVWIMNHYATNSYFNEGGRHYWFAENLIDQGYDPTIFCSTVRHNTNDAISTNRRKFKVNTANGIPFVFVKTSRYKGNGLSRINSILSFSINLILIAKTYAKKHGKPDVIIASSVHPLTMVAGIRVAKKFNIPCICEVRDLWPESLVAYGILKRNNIITKSMYLGEKEIYKKSNSVIMTWEGGRQYISDQGWDKEIDLNKVKHISNGVTIDTFDKNYQENKVNDSDLDNYNFKNIVYTGSIRRVNNLGLLLDAAKIVQKENKNIKFLFYGSGDEKDMLEKRCEKENIINVIFKGQVEKKMIPSILKKSYANILHNSSTSLDKYGQSQNKFFEYLAAGKCIIQTYSTGYSMLEKYSCGISAIEQTPYEIATVILEACNNEEDVRKMGVNARKAAYDFDFDKLTNKLIQIIENV